MSYKLIKKINAQLLKEVSDVFFPFQYGTAGAFLSSVMLPYYGTEALSIIFRNFSKEELASTDYSLSSLREYLEGFNNRELSAVVEKIFNYINEEYLGIFRSFLEADAWQVDNQLANVLEENDELRDSIMLFVFSMPVFPVSELMAEVMIDFHIFEPDESYMEMQSILSEFYTETPRCQRTYLAWKYLDSVNDEARIKIISLIESRVPFICDGCGRDIKSPTPYITRVEVYPSRNVNFDMYDCESRDFEKEIYSSVEAVKDKSDKELARDMWSEYRLFLCQTCRNTFIKRIDSGEFI